jgi:hypothetical protein
MVVLATQKEHVNEVESVLSTLLSRWRRRVGELHTTDLIKFPTNGLDIAIIFSAIIAAGVLRAGTARRGRRFLRTSLTSLRAEAQLGEVEERVHRV